MHRGIIIPHKSLRRTIFHWNGLIAGTVVAACLDIFLIAKGNILLAFHSKVTEFLLQVAEVPWQVGRTVTILPGANVGLLRTGFLQYEPDSLYPWLCFVITCGIALLGYQRWPAPVRPLLFLVPFSLGTSMLYSQFVAVNGPYTAEDFSALWYHGETYLWLLLPWILAVGVFPLGVPWTLKFGSLALLLAYSFLWSCIRLATALATFYFLGSLWMPLFYFLFGFFADFLYIIALYSVTADRAAAWMSSRSEVWE